MRLSTPVYETLPLAYTVIGAAGLFLSYLDPNGLRGIIAFVIGLSAVVCALTLYLHRRNFRALNREYSGYPGDWPAP